MRILFQTIGAGALLIGASNGWAADAKEVYLDKCAVCHGADGAGKTAKGRKLKVKDVHEMAAKMSAEEMIKITTDGKGANMDGFGKELGKDQVKSVVEYYRSLAK